MAIQGVNLGGWLVLERWITPSLFEGYSARDEFTLCQERGAEATQIVNHHRKTFITSDDIVWLKNQGITALRVPVPHWIFGGFASYVPGIRFIDWLMDEARHQDLKILLELHTAPGSQNGHDHSGKKGNINWPKSSALIKATLEVVELLAARYGASRQLLGIGLLNEPSPRMDRHLLEIYYQEGYKRVRSYCRDDVAVVINDQFNPLDWNHVMTGPEYVNVWLDTHFYQAFSTAKQPQEVIDTVKDGWGQVIKEVQASRPLMVGEWSLGLPKQTFAGMDEDEAKEIVAGYWQAQNDTFSHATAHFFWTYKTENMLGWSYRDFVEEGIATV